MMNTEIRVAVVKVSTMNQDVYAEQIAELRNEGYEVVFETVFSQASHNGLDDDEGDHDEGDVDGITFHDTYFFARLEMELTPVSVEEIMAAHKSTVKAN